MNHTTEKEVLSKELVEKSGVLMEQMGFTRMIGRLMGYLFIAEPPYKTFTDIQDYLQASKSSISTSLQFVINQGLVVYFTVPGDRKRYFKLNAESWSDLIKKDIGQLTQARKLIEECIAVRSEAYPQFNRSLKEISDLYAFLEKELPVLIERWEKSRR
jgi:DNA-binding transcriptional regulator GbsR (MarR family)